MAKPFKPALLLSISLHCGLIACFIYLVHHAVLYSLPQHNTLIMHAYLKTETNHVHTTAQLHHLKSAMPMVTPAPSHLMQHIQHTTPKATKPKPHTLQHTLKSPAAVQAHTLAPKQVQALLILISQQIEKNLQYPETAQTQIQQGQAMLQFTMTPHGKLENTQIIQSSGNPSLDQAAITAIQKSSPIHIPIILSFSQSLTLKLPIYFSIAH